MSRNDLEAALVPGLSTILLLSSIGALGQFAVSFYSPALPDLARDFHVDAAQAQLTFVYFLLSFAIGQLLFGPLSDRFGRRPVLFAGLILFLAGTIGCALADSLTLLILARVVQAFGAAAGVIISRAAARDSFEGVELVQILAVVTIVTALAPGLAPLLGGLLHTWLGWRAIFWCTAAVGLVLALIMAAYFPETNARHGGATAIRTVIMDYIGVAGDRPFLAYAAATGLVFSSTFAFLSAAPELYIVHLDVTPAEYGIYPPIAMTGFIIGGVLARLLSVHFPPRQLAAAGLLAMGVAIGGMLALPLFGVIHKHLFNVTLIAFITGQGLFLPIAIAGALERHPDRAGTAASVQGFLQMGGGALGALVAGIAQSHLPIVGLPFTMFVAILLAAASFYCTPAAGDENL